MSQDTSNLKLFEWNEIKRHNTADDCWVVIDGTVYDVSKFMAVHPGGSVVMLDPSVAGQDATETFYSLHRQEVLRRPIYARLVIGRVRGHTPTIRIAQPGDLSRVPYAEPSWLRPFSSSPFFKAHHHRLQRAMRVWVDSTLQPEADAREADGKHITRSLVKQSCDLGLMAMRMGPGDHLKPFTLLGGGVIEPSEFDYFAEMIVTQEMTRCGQRGFADGNLAGNVIGLPPVMNFAQPQVRERVMREVLSGEKIICLAITEPFAGSDVANLRTTAEKTPDGKHWIINGVKKWITNGMFSDYFSVGCRTGPNALTMILVERGPGVTTRAVKTSYSSCAGTSYVQFKNVKVPVENTLGKEGGGLQVILSNFNHERLVLCAGSCRLSRLIVEECFKYASQRKVFGKSLLEQPVIRQQLASMIAHVESMQSWLESITHQMNNMTYKEQSEHLAGPIALLKYQCTRAEHEISDKATQLFGGRGITQGGMGARIESMQRTYKFNAILGGSEEILADLGVRQAIRSFPKDVRL